MTEPTVTKEPGFIRFIMAANRTGGGSVFAVLTGLLVGFGTGWYMKSQQFDDKNQEIVVQATENQSITIEAHERLKKSHDDLNQSLAYIGYNTDDIQELLGGKASGLDSLKNKFTRLIKGKTIYLPRNDCGDDYLGQESSDEANKIIINGFHNRYKPND